MKKAVRLAIVLLLAAVLALGAIYLFDRGRGSNLQGYISDTGERLKDAISKPKLPTIFVERVLSGKDNDGDGTDDLEDIVLGARKDAENKPSYKDAYYRGGYPPDNEGVCTDVVWRAFKKAGYTLKDMVDKDIHEHPRDYPRIAEDGKPDPNIDFRRIPNLVSFFKKYALILTNEIKPRNSENLKEWQGGDIVVFGGTVKHIAIISDKRNADGVPYIIHNGGPYTREEDTLLDWSNDISKITWHFRWPKP